MKTKLAFVAIALFACFYSTSAQTPVPTPLKEFVTSSSTLEWLFLKPDQDLDPNGLWGLLEASLDIDPASFYSVKSYNSDPQGWTHAKFTHLVDSIPVEGSEYILHVRNGRVEKANGHIALGTFPQAPPLLSPLEACIEAHRSSPADQLAWDHSDPAQWDSLPPTELVFAKQNPGTDHHASNYRLCFKVQVEALAPFGGDYVYIDALTGVPFKSLPYIFSCVSGTGNTLYNGSQDLDTEDRGWPHNDYFLKDDCRGSFIQTFNRHNSTNTNVYDSDNNWLTNHRAEVSIQWSAAQTYDYFQSEHSRNSVDNSGRRIKLVYRLDNNYSPYNASWDSDKDKGYFGEADGIQPFVSLDVVAHEITHGVVYHTAELEYAGESGALNESFADIFGTCVEHRSVGLFGPAGSEDWEMGEDIAGGALRDLENPLLHNDPAFFLGDNWVNVTANCNGTNDQCGVHTNSGVQNRWFFLLAQGGTVVDTLVNNGEIRVCGIGMQDAARIAYRNLRFYLTQNSGYQDARTGAVQAAIDLFGLGSFQVDQCVNAWHAVGVGTSVEQCAEVAASESQPNIPPTFTISPNPTTAEANLLIENLPGTKLSIELLDMKGVSLPMSQRFFRSPLSGTAEVPLLLTNPPAGLYFVRIRWRNGLEVKKIMVQ